MRLGVSCSPDYAFAEFCGLASNLGFEGIQPHIVPSLLAFEPDKALHPRYNNKGSILEADFISDPKAALLPATQAGLEITSLATYASTADMDRAVALLKASHEVGIRHVRIAALGLPPNDIVDMKTLLERSKATYRELAAEAKKLKVRPCIELRGGTPCPSPSGLAAFLRDFDPEDVGVFYDPCNMVEEGWESPRTSVAYLRHLLAEVHVKNCEWVSQGLDADGSVAWGTRYCHLDEGAVSWPDVIGQLKAIEYSGWLVEESWLPDCSPFVQLRRSLDLLRRLIREVPAVAWVTD